MADPFQHVDLDVADQVEAMLTGQPRPTQPTGQRVPDDKTAPRHRKTQGPGA